MAQYGNSYVDEKYSAIVAPNLYGDSILQPGVTFSDEHQGDAAAGLVKIYKITRDSAGDPVPPASDFSHEAVANELIDLRLNNTFHGSKKLHKVVANSVAYAAGEKHMSTLVQDKREDYQRSGLACLVKEGTADSNTTALTKDNIKSRIIATRKALRDKHAKPDVCAMTTEAYALMLEVAGNAYTPIANESVNNTGRVGVWLGIRFEEADLLAASAKYYDNAGTLQTVDMTKVDFIMYDHRAFSIVSNLEASRIVDSENFIGSLVQFEMNTGYRVNNSDMVLVKSHA